MTNTRTGARLPQTNLTGLGAVGGPQGVAAGSLRVILEFLTQYDPSAVKQMETDLAKLNTDLAKYNADAAARANSNLNLQKRITTAEQKIADAGAIANTRRYSKELAAIRTLAKDPTTREKAQTRLDQLVTEVKSVTTLTARQEADMRKLLTLDVSRLSGKAKLAALEAQIAVLLKQQEVSETNLTRMQQLRQGIGGKLGSLAIGAIGATIGGTILAGTVFMAMQAAVEAVGTAIQENIIDPGKRAREAMLELGKSINAVGEATLSDTLKVNQWLQQFGLQVDEATESALAQAAAVSRAQGAIDAYKQAVEASSNPEAARKKQIEELAAVLERQDDINGKLVQTHEKMGYSTALVTDKQYYLNLAEQQYIPIAGAAADAARNEAAAKAGLARANDVAAFTQQMLNQQIQAGLDRAGASYDARIEAIPDASARTKRLQAQLNRAQSGGGGGGSNNSQLANIAEERALTLLRMRLRELGTAIKIGKYEGKFRLEAINAKIKALQKEGDAQKRVNDLLDLQYRMSKEIRREQGESIKDYLARRAQENRAMLAESDQMRRDAQVNKLNEQKERLEDEIKLQELAEQAKQAAIQGTTAANNDALQKRLAASIKHDQKVAEARKRALEKQKKDLIDAANKAIEIATAEQTATWRTALWGMDNINDLNIVSGHLSGLLRGKAALQSLAKAWGVPQAVVAPFLAQIEKQLGYYYSRKSALSDKALNIPGRVGGIKLAEGGVIKLNNSSTPFGRNVQFGENGTELGVVLSTKVTDQLRRMNFPQQIGPFMIQSSGDPLRDQFAFKRLVKEAVAEVLR